MSYRTVSRIASVFLLVPLSSLSAPQQQPGALPAAVQQEIIADISAARDAEYDVSADGRRIVWRDKRDKGWAVWINGEREATEYQKVEDLRFTPDGRRLSFKAKLNGKWHFVVDGEPGPAYDEVKDLDFTRDGKRFAYRSKVAGTWAIVTGGESLMPTAGETRSRGAACDEVGPPRFSDDSQRLAYTAKRNKKEMVVVDGVPGPGYDEVGEPVFSPDSHHLVYPAKRSKKWVVVRDGAELPLEMKDIWRGRLGLKNKTFLIGLPWAYFHPNEGLIYFGRLDEAWSLIIAGQPGPEFDVVTWPVFWGADEQHYAYAGAKFDGTWTGVKGLGQVVVDSEAGPVYEGKNTKTSAGTTTQTGWGSALANALASAITAGIVAALEYDTDQGGYESGIGLTHGAIRNFRARSFGVSTPKVSPDGEHIAYAARRDDEDYVVVHDGELGPKFESIECGPMFTPKGSLVYVAVKENKLFLMRDGDTASEFPWEDADCTQLWAATDLAGSRTPISRSNYWAPVKRSSDATTLPEHLIYVGAENGRRRVFIDGIPGPEYEAEAVAVKTHFIGNELHLAYVMIDGTKSALFVVDDQEARPYSQVFLKTLRFSEDGTVSYVARTEDRFFRMTHRLQRLPQTTRVRGERLQFVQ